MTLVDTNVLIYAANPSFSEHRACRRLLNELRSSPIPWFTTWSIFYEFFRVVTHRRVFERPWSAAGAWTYIESLLASSSLSVLLPTKHHREVLQATLREHPELRGNIFHDTHTAVLMREHGIRKIYTRDTDFDRFAFVEALDPLSDRE